MRRTRHHASLILSLDWPRVLAVVALTLVWLAMTGSSAVYADILIHDNVAVVSNGPIDKDLDRWRVGQLNGWGGCLFIGMSSEANREICGCLGQRRTGVEPAGVEFSLDNVQACAALFIEGTWNSAWSPQLANQAPVTFDYDLNSGTITGCWAEQTGNGEVTGIIKDAVFNMRAKTLSFSYHDASRNADGKAILVLSNSEQGLTLSGSWLQPGNTGQWTLIRDPIRRSLVCGKYQAP